MRTSPEINPLSSMKKSHWSVSSRPLKSGAVSVPTPSWAFMESQASSLLKSSSTCGIKNCSDHHLSALIYTQLMQVQSSRENRRQTLETALVLVVQWLRLNNPIRLIKSCKTLQETFPLLYSRKICKKRKRRSDCKLFREKHAIIFVWSLNSHSFND